MKTWGSEVLTSADMKTYLTDNIEFLYGQTQGLVFSGFKINRTSDQTIATATDTTVVWQNEDLDVGGWWSSGGTVTTPAAAIPSGYGTVAIAVMCSLRYASNGTGGRAVHLLRNGSSVDNTYVGAASDTFTSVDLVTFTLAQAGQTFTVETRQTSGGNLALDVAKLRVYRIGPI